MFDKAIPGTGSDSKGIHTAGDQGKKQTSQDQVEDEPTQSLIKVNLVEL